PQMPASWLVARANSRQSCATVQAVQIRRAVSICSRAVPVIPMGKNTSGSESRHAERVRQDSRSHSWVRIQVRATNFDLRRYWSRWFGRTAWPRGAVVLGTSPRGEPAPYVETRSRTRGLTWGFVRPPQRCPTFPQHFPKRRWMSGVRGEWEE